MVSIDNPTDWPAASKSFIRSLNRTLEKLGADLASWDTDDARLRFKSSYIEEQKSELTTKARATALRDAKGALRVTGNWVDVAQQKINAARTKAASSDDWESLGIRSREFESMIAAARSNGAHPAAEVRRLRDQMAAAGDHTGLRALRLASRSHLTEWRRTEQNSRHAAELSDLFAQDEKAAVPGLDKLEADLKAAEAARYEAQRAVELAARVLEPERYRDRFHSPGTGQRTAFEREAAGQAADPWMSGGVVWPESA